MSVWQLTSQINGYIEANTPEDKKNRGLSDSEFDELSTLIDRT